MAHPSARRFRPFVTQRVRTHGSPLAMDDGRIYARDDQDEPVQRTLRRYDPPRGGGTWPDVQLSELPETESRSAGGSNYEQNVNKRADFSPLTRSRTGAVERNPQVMGRAWIGSEANFRAQAEDTRRRLEAINAVNRRYYRDTANPVIEAAGEHHTHHSAGDPPWDYPTAPNPDLQRNVEENDQSIRQHAHAHGRQLADERPGQVRHFTRNKATDALAALNELNRSTWQARNPANPSYGRSSHGCIDSRPGNRNYSAAAAAEE